MSDEWVELCDPKYGNQWALDGLDIESCLDKCKNDSMCARANWYEDASENADHIGLGFGLSPLGLCRMFRIGAGACEQSGDQLENSAEL